MCNIATAGETMTKGVVSSIHTPSMQYWMCLLVIPMRDMIAVDVGCCGTNPTDLVGIVAICVTWQGVSFEFMVLMSIEFIILWSLCRVGCPMCSGVLDVTLLLGHQR